MTREIIITESEVERMSERLTPEDISDGEELYEMLEALPENEKKQALIYVRALSDRTLLLTDDKTGGGRNG